MTSLVIKLLFEVYLEQKYSNLSMQKVNISASDAKIFYGTLENDLYLSKIIEYQFTKKIDKKSLILIKAILYQIIFLEQNKAKVLNQNLDVAKQYLKIAQIKFINYFIRHFNFTQLKFNYSDSIEFLAIKTSHPLFLVKMWSKQYGEEIAKKICENNVKNRTNYFFSLEETNYPKTDFKYCYRFEGKDLNKVLKEKYLIQDLASQQVVQMIDFSSCEQVLDLCAAPGTKATQFSLLYPEAKIDLVDIHAHRLKLVNYLIDKFNLTNLTCIEADATTFNNQKKYDLVMIDAPCCGYGVLNTKVDIKLRIDGSEMDQIISLQEKILDNGLKLMKKQAYLLYSTCSLNKKENEHQIQRILRMNPNLKLITEKTIFPFEYNNSGFYMALVKYE